MAKITVALMKELEKQVALGDISYSRMIEILNAQINLNENSQFEYFKIKADRIENRGERYFKMKFGSNHVMQICLDDKTNTKRGRGHYIGIYKITRVTFFSNWYPIWIESCEENEYNEAFEKAVLFLKKY